MIERKTVSQCVSSDYCKGWNDAVDKMPKWINVKERMPQEDGSYIVCTAKGSVYCTKFSTRFDPSFHKTGCVTITHWMPLPEPPKED